MLNLRPHYLLAGLVLVLLVASQSPLFAQVPECPPAAALLSSNDPAYADAMELKQSLENHGFTVRCVFPTKFGSIFQVIEGALCAAQLKAKPTSVQTMATSMPSSCQAPNLYGFQ